MILTCKAPGCLNQDHPVPVPDDGTMVICGGGCGNILRSTNLEHPNYPEIPESSAAHNRPEELMDDRLRHWGLIPPE